MTLKVFTNTHTHSHTHKDTDTNTKYESCYNKPFTVYWVISSTANIRTGNIRQGRLSETDIFCENFLRPNLIRVANFYYFSTKPIISIQHKLHDTVGWVLNAQ